MSVLVKAKTLGDVFKWETEGEYCRAVKTALSGQSLSLGQVCTTNSAGKKIAVAGTGNEVHTYTQQGGAATAGTYKLRVWHKDGYWVETGWIAYNVNADAALEALLGTSGTSVVVSAAPSAGAAFTITFSGTGYAALSQPTGYMDCSQLTTATSCIVTRTTAAGALGNERQTIVYGVAATGGTVRFGLTINGAVVWTDAAAWSATDATFLSNMQAALDQVCGTNGVVVTARAAVDTDLGCVLTFSGTGFAGIPQPAVQVDPSALTSVTSATVTRDSVADSIAMADIDASAGDVAGLFMVRGPAIVDSSQLVYGAANPDFTKLALAEVGIVARTEAAQTEVQVN